MLDAVTSPAVSKNIWPPLLVWKGGVAVVAKVASEGADLLFNLRHFLSSFAIYLPYIHAP